MQYLFPDFNTICENSQRVTIDKINNIYFCMESTPVNELAIAGKHLINWYRVGIFFRSLCAARSPDRDPTRVLLLLVDLNIYEKVAIDSIVFLDSRWCIRSEAMKIRGNGTRDRVIIQHLSHSALETSISTIVISLNQNMIQTKIS